MTSEEIREAFLRFFEGKGHKVMPSSSLIPQGDPTLLLTTAGMVQFKPYFMGQAIPPSPRLASCQKCFRTTDIDSVGDRKHLTFFEMLGNFSVSDYFKREAIAYAWEFVTKNLGLPRERLWITIFHDDEEACKHWQEVGVPAERIIRHGEKDNFWGPAGDSGPCGPCSEIHYDFGVDFGCGVETCTIDCDCNRYLELWNLVFIEYYQDAAGQRSPLPKKNIDTGMGLERMATVMQGQHSFYDTDLFAPIVQFVSRRAGVEYGRDKKTDRAIRVIAEHGRAIAFLIADGVVPSNEGRGYVLRRVLRRAALSGRKLGIKGRFLEDVAVEVLKRMRHIYPELAEKQIEIRTVIDDEEKRFHGTLGSGLDLLLVVLAQEKERGARTISGEVAFHLYDTYGLPRDMLADVAGESGFEVDWEGFEAEMRQQRERARAAQRFGVGQRETILDYTSLSLPATEFVGYDEDSCESRVINLAIGDVSVEDSLVNDAHVGEEVEVVLDRTSFYGEMGGQVGDTGQIRGSQGTVVITQTLRPRSDLIVHRGRVATGLLVLKEKVRAEVDVARRLDIARNHTATHLLQAALRQVLGSHIRQAGSLVAPDRLRFDFSHTAPITEDELARVQRIVNENIRQNLVVTAREVPYAQAIAEGALAFFGEKYGDVVRMVEIKAPDEPKALSAELCGGTHVTRTGDIGFCQVVAESSIGAGMRRIEAVTGRGAEAFVSERLASLELIARQLQVPLAEAQARVASIIAELGSEQKRAAALEHQLARKAAASLLSQVELVDGVSVLAARISASNMETLRQMGDWLREMLGSAVIVLGAVWTDKPNLLAMVTQDLVARGLHAGQIAKQVAVVVGGGGGGRPQLGQAGGGDKSKLDEALRLVTKLVAENWQGNAHPGA